MPQNRQLSGLITVTTAGTAVQGPDISAWEPAQSGGGFWVRATNANTGLIYVGNDGAGDVTSANGFELGAGDAALVRADNLNEIWFDSSADGETASWLRA